MAISSQAPQECGEGSTTRAYDPERIMKPHERAEIRRCSGCKETKPLNCYSKDGFYCKPCARAYLKQYRDKNGARLSVLKKKWYLDNRERILLEKREYTRRVSSDVMEKRRVKRQSDPLAMAKHNHAGALRRASETRSTPVWADLEKISEFYLLARRLSKETGIRYSVDHICPLRSELVCGLHVHNNLQVIPLVENCSKQNKYELKI